MSDVVILSLFDGRIPIACLLTSLFLFGCAYVCRGNAFLCAVFCALTFLVLMVRV